MRLNERPKRKNTEDRLAANGVRDAETMRQACERMDRVSEQIDQRHGVLDMGTPAIRELREAE